MGSEDSLYPFGVHMLTSEGWTSEQVLDLCAKVKESYVKIDTKNKSFLVEKYYFKA